VSREKIPGPFFPAQFRLRPQDEKQDLPLPVPYGKEDKPMHSKAQSHNSVFGIAWNSVLGLMLVLLVLIVVILFIVFTAQPAQGQTFQVIHSFASGADGAH